MKGSVVFRLGLFLDYVDSFFHLDNMFTAVTSAALKELPVDSHEIDFSPLARHVTRHRYAVRFRLRIQKTKVNIPQKNSKTPSRHHGSEHRATSQDIIDANSK